MCNIWATLDVLNCTASILHMCVMSVERYLAICHPLFHRKRRHSFFQKVGIKIALVWLISIFLSSLLFTLGQVIPEAVYLDRACRVQHVYFQVYGSIFAFFIPLAIVVISYMMTAIKLLQKSRAYDGTLTNTTRVGTLTNSTRAVKLTRRAHSLRQFILENGKIPEEDSPSAKNSELVPLSPTASSPTASLERSKSSVSIRINHSSYKVSTTSSSLPNRNGSQTHREGRRGSAPPLCLCQDRHSKRRKQKRSSPKSSLKTNSLRSNLSASSINANSVHVSKEHQANIVLGLVFACFVISWAPFFILNIYFALCESCEPDPTMMQFFEWLGWASSSINPFIYTAFNQTFRRTFWRLLRCHCLWGQRRRARWNSQNREQVRSHGEQVKAHMQCNHNNSTCV